MTSQPSHPPDEYTQQARSLLERMTPKPYATDVEAVAEAIADAYRRGAEEMREQHMAELRDMRGMYSGAEIAALLGDLALPAGPAAPAGDPLAAYIAENAAYTIEPHGDGEALYLGRDDHHHGLNIAHIVEPDPTRWPEARARILAALNTRRVRRGGEP